MWRSRIAHVQSTAAAAAAAAAATTRAQSDAAPATTLTTAATTASSVQAHTAAADTSAPALKPATAVAYGPLPQRLRRRWPLLRPRSGSTRPTTYVSRASPGHPDPVALLLRGGRPDTEWVWLRLLCLFCVGATVGTWLYGVYFNEKVKYFKDEPWSPFRN